MKRLAAAGAVALLLSSGAAWADDDLQTAAGGEAGACRAEISRLRYRVGGEEGLKKGDHELLGGLTADQAGEPEENWFGSPPDKEATLDKLDEAAELAGNGDGEGCQAIVEEVQRALAESGKEGKADSGG